MSQTETWLPETTPGDYDVTSTHPGLVVCLTSVSAGGKSFTAEQLVAAGEVNPHFTETDRARRPDEQDALHDHHFITPEEYERRRQAGAYLVMHSLYSNNYGLPPFPRPQQPHKPTLLLIKPDVAPDIRRAVPCVKIYAIESRDGLTRLASRMRDRGQNEDDIERRVARAKTEEEAGRKVADPGRLFVANGHPREVLGAIRHALREDFARHTQDCALTRTAANL